MKRIVIKIGSNIIAGSEEGLDMSVISRIAEDISQITSEGNEVAVVSSGAVAAGMKKLGLKTRPTEIRLKQAAAAAGQSNLMWAYERSFSSFGRKVAQVLLTREDFADRKRYINAKNTMMTLLSYGIIPVINENDTVAIDEIRFGDNDSLASLVAISIEADNLFILSDVDGLYADDPKKSQHAELISYVESITPEIEQLAGATGSIVGTGGMYSKVKAAKKAASHGIGVYIINGRKAGQLIPAVTGQHCGGTFFKPRKNRIPQRKGWIAYSSRAKGSLVIDDGAVKALRESGKSLLPSGIVSVDGSFETGDSVYCVTVHGKRIAKGLANYASEDLRKIQGKKTIEIEKILGYKYSDEVIHRDNLVII
ncbi:MAG: glutamate 5-kinase [Nitrospirae bacterium]|nr:glutamate 5-kinase [Nitrospirota bacterium]